MLKRLIAFARAVLGRSAFERDMDDEMRFHLENRDRGSGRARALARRRRAAGPPRVRIHRKAEGRGARRRRPPPVRRGARRSALRVPHVRRQQRVHGHGDRHACARHRRQRGDLQPDGRADAALAAGGQAATTAAAVARVAGRQERRCQRLVSTRARRRSAARHLHRRRGLLIVPASPSAPGPRCRESRAPSSRAASTRPSACNRRPAGCCRAPTTRRGRRWSRSPATATGSAPSRAIRASSAARSCVNGVPADIVGVSPRGFTGATVGTIADLTLPDRRASHRHPAGRRSARTGQFVAARAGEAATGRGAR